MSADSVGIPQISREKNGRPAAPERIVHLGIGNFTRAHQAWYTEHAPDAAQWGIAGFTGRGPRMRDLLESQDCVYTLITSGAQNDEFEVISSLSSMHSGSDTAALRARFADPNISIVTSTVTEAGYMRAHNGDLDVANADVAADLRALKANSRADGLKTVPVRMVAGFLARRRAGVGPITVLPCDNLAGNGAAFRKVVEQAIAEVDPSLLDWTRLNVAWATSMVDRITPATTQNDIELVERVKGWHDAAPVRTEPFREWVIAGDFPSGRPAWDEAGAVITDDVTPYEQRKLWMLNGSHTTLAYCGSLFGYETVADAVADPTLRSWINEWWDLAGHYVSVPTDEYRKQLLERFENPNIRHLLLQIATDGSEKLPVRIVPAARKALKDGRSTAPAARAIAAWILFLTRFTDKLADVNKDKVVAYAKACFESDGSIDDDGVKHVVAYLDHSLASSAAFVDEVVSQIGVVSQFAAANRQA
ncbi:mannitol dehydrogenase family protein [Bifidobacterium sp. ESL0745]|uniref:mannitol dehydrogenase family protein n=1 Tax=Bifidobacterium sp. ESL0745 TaxID=2983226 RepID=UPI0023F87B10|nr:mannitol dehydrogenase family protein [Bifidobacterium sp. ESL0745]MDF7666112.1 mannitol dehydrogenase family protein [Bifidobacterium sp. ESL0745]